MEGEGEEAFAPKRFDIKADIDRDRKARLGGRTAGIVLLAPEIG